MKISIMYMDRFFIGNPIRELPPVESTDRAQMTALYKGLFELMVDDRILALDFVNFEKQLKDSGYTPTKKESEFINSGII